ETKEEAVLRNLYKDSQLYDTITQYSPGLAYHTAPTIDAAVEFAKKGLKDGSLQKMTDEEVLEASRDIVNKSSCTKAQVASYILDAAQGTKNPIIEAAKERDEQARNNMTLDRKEIDAKHDESYNQYVEGRTKMIRKAVGLPEEKKTEKDSGNEEDKSFIKTYRMFKQKEEKKELDKWKNDLARHLSKKGGDRKALLEIISSEKDKVRKLDVNDVVAKQKIAIMNVLLTEPEIIINLANAKKVVKSEIQKTEAPKSEAKGIEAAGEFVSLAIKSYEIAEKGIEKALKRKDSTLSIDGQMKVLSSERRDYKKLLKAERATQVAAFKVRKDPVAWAAVKENPEISALVTEKSKQRHAQWVDKYHSNLLENKTDVTSELIAGVLSSKIDILVEVGSSDVLLKALRKVDAKTANKYLKQEKKETPVAAIVKNRVASR
ncbi:MAG: hypothetical protein KAJ75_09880, partial [Alphaproteobacteria bacterium]|nr:hypothetical protein [Alphaproteobacteria bacterium]